MIKDQDKLDRQVQVIVEIYERLEVEMIENIAKVFATGKNISAAAEWQMSKLTQIEAVRRKNEELFSSVVDELWEKVAELLYDAGYEVLELSEDVLFDAYEDGKLNRYIPIEESVALDTTYKYWRDQTIEYLSVANNTMLQSANDELRKIVSQATLSTVTGTESRIEAVRKAVKQMAEKGITAAIYKNGARVPIDVYANMKLRTNRS